MPHTARLLVLSTLIAAGCQTRNKVRQAPSDAGVAATYAAPLGRVHTASRDAIAEMGFTVREDEGTDATGWRILASQGLSSGTLGRITRVVLEQQSATATVVRVLVESKLDTQEAAAADNAMANELQRKIAGRLGAQPASAPASSPASR
jgi:FAD/FMN-containing dehydrogenase